MKTFRILIKQIDWLDVDEHEAEVCFELGNSQYWAFCHPCELHEGESVCVQFPFIMNDEVSFGKNSSDDIKIVPSVANRWSYHCCGKVISINPVIADCGDLQFELGDFTHDDRVVGNLIYFVIDRLDMMVCLY